MAAAFYDTGSGLCFMVESIEVAKMAMPQRDDPPSRCALRRTGTTEAIKRLDVCGRLRALRVRRWRISPPKRSFCGASLEHAVMHNDEAEADRLRAELRSLTEEI